MKKTIYLEFLLFFVILTTYSFGSGPLVPVISFIVLLTINSRSSSATRKLLRIEAPSLSDFFLARYLHDFFLSLASALLLSIMFAESHGTGLDPLNFLWLYLFYCLYSMAEEFSYFHSLPDRFLINMMFFLPLGIISAFAYYSKMIVPDFILSTLLLCLPGILILCLAWGKKTNHSWSRYLYPLRHGSVLFLALTGWGFIQVNAIWKPHSPTVAYLAILTKNDDLMKSYIDHGGDLGLLIKRSTQLVALAPALIHRGMYQSLAHLQKKGIDFSTQDAEYLKRHGQDVLIPIALKDDVEAFEFVEHLPLRYDLRYTIRHSNILHFVSNHCSTRVAERIIHKISREMLYEANDKGLTPLTMAAEQQCQSVLDVYAKLSPNWNHTDRRGRSVASIKKSASQIVRNL